MADVLASLRPFQDAARPPFRVVVHRGRVFLGEGAVPGEENLAGPEVSVVFRMEKLAHRGGWPCPLSEPACQAMGRHVTAEPVGEHELPGLAARHTFYRL